MKTPLSIVLALIIIFSLTACDGESGTVTQPVSVTTQSQQIEDVSVVTTQKTTNQSENQVTIEETVLVDEVGVKITAKSLDPNAMFGPEIKLLIENNSGKNLTFQCRYASINGYMIEPMMSVDVVDGKKANDSLTFMESDLELCGIETIADIEFSLHIFTTDGWDDYLNTPQIQMKTSAAGTYNYIFDDLGDVAYEGHGAKIVIKGLAEDSSIFGPSVIVYIDNTGDDDISVQVRDVSINGFMVEPIFSSDVISGKHIIDTITFMSTELEENDISDVKDIELSFHVFDMATWDTIVDTDPIVITF